METKQWYQSTSILGSIVTVIALFASIFNYTIDVEAQDQIVSIIIAVFGLVGSVYAIVGRVKATKSIAGKMAIGDIKPIEAPVVGIDTSSPISVNETLQPILVAAKTAYNQVVADSIQELSTQTK